MRAVATELETASVDVDDFFTGQHFPASVTITRTSEIYFEVVNRSGWGTLAMTVLFGIGPLYLTVKRM